MRVGIVGAGNIVKWCLDALSHIEEIRCEAICVRESSVHKAQQLCDEYRINKLYTDYARMLNDPDVDFIYLGIPNKLHYEYALLALKTGKHVICEKPFTSEVQELMTLAELARNNQCFLFEAITNIHSPNIQIMKECLKKVGQVKFVQSNYSQLSSRYHQYLEGHVHPAFDPALSGGALYDINVYNIHLSCYLFGSPKQITYTCNKGFNGIDTSGVMVMQYPDFISVCTGAKDSASPGQVVIQGVDGCLTLTSAPNVAASVELDVQGNKQCFNANHADNHMEYEFRHFYQMYSENDFTACYRYLDHSISVMQILTQGREQAGIIFQ
ncbi:gfo/Idh/MocA family oxidoreductase [Vibrio sp. HA2012]|uniref:Gfo/Idh/MocA family protein n=1 Tax=Vibrio sp. HA2012 TaxID=1971595 RepID=UPI000C2B7B5D|nr:Gfo/Idh/MocA family oxidoreductase [Vibrio sp. HA2012]PJC86654.1 gfo/Idh/MocA family oxidoreductase [Vibrio sp. HA2012]